MRRTESKVLGEEPAPREVAHHVPCVWQPDLAPRAPQLALGIQAPDRVDLLRGLVAHDLANCTARVVEPAHA